ncbi:hypothetical protein C2S51_022957 [Perilla frutescens var. frutescens]|nr:hypothetical protein C2S51_022957 [Perilla frutescens var. frutescens]
MARSFSNIKTVSSFVANEISAVVSRRGYSAASQSQVVASNSGKVNVMVKKASEKSVETAWVPDPVTGFYRPETQVKELDPVELRKMHIRNKNRAK